MKRLMLIGATSLGFLGVGVGVFSIMPINESNAQVVQYQVDVYLKNPSVISVCRAGLPDVVKMKHGLKPCECPGIYEGPYTGYSSTPGQTCP